MATKGAAQSAGCRGSASAGIGIAFITIAINSISGPHLPCTAGSRQGQGSMSGLCPLHGAPSCGRCWLTSHGVGHPLQGGGAGERDSTSPGWDSADWLQTTRLLRPGAWKDGFGDLSWKRARRHVNAGSS